jgi:hypothetical protein
MRLRLRAAFVEDHGQQRKMLADVDEMSAMSNRHSPAHEMMRSGSPECSSISALSSRAFARTHSMRMPWSPSRRRMASMSHMSARSNLAGPLANLIDTAIKYGGGAHVSLRSEPGRVVTSIDDSGPGIPLEEREKVFAPFYRFERSRNRETASAFR